MRVYCRRRSAWRGRARRARCAPWPSSIAATTTRAAVGVCGHVHARGVPSRNKALCTELERAWPRVEAGAERRRMIGTVAVGSRACDGRARGGARWGVAWLALRDIGSGQAWCMKQWKGTGESVIGVRPVWQEVPGRPTTFVLLRFA